MHTTITPYIPRQSVKAVASFSLGDSNEAANIDSFGENCKSNFQHLRRSNPLSKILFNVGFIKKCQAKTIFNYIMISPIIISQALNAPSGR